MDNVPYQRATLSPAVPIRSDLTKAELEASTKADIVEVDTSTGAITLDFLPTSWPDGHLLILKLSDVANTLTFDRVVGAATATKNIQIPDNVGTPTLTELSHKVAFRWKEGTGVADSYWILEYGNFDSHIVYDRANDIWGYGGSSIGTYKHGITGDVIIQDDTGEATLTVQHTGVGGSDAAVLRLIADSPTVVWNDDAGATDRKLLQVGYTNDSLAFTFYDDSSVAYATPLELKTDGSLGSVYLNALPTSDPGNPGQLYRTGGAVMISI